jgi:hypothetical protein
MPVHSAKWMYASFVFFRQALWQFHDNFFFQLLMCYVSLFFSYPFLVPFAVILRQTCVEWLLVFPLLDWCIDVLVVNVCFDHWDDECLEYSMAILIVGVFCSPQVVALCLQRLP